MKLNLSGLPIEQKIGQLFFIGLPGAELDDNSAELLEEISPGGICLFSRNIRSAEQTRTLLADVRECLPVEPFLSLDQEGGLVDRLRRVITPMPSAKAVSQNKNPETIRRLAQITAEAVRILGFNMNFAPVVDVVDENREKFVNGLYSRGFGISKEEVVEFAGAYLETLQTGGCLGTIKHFPGYGATEVDSHEELPLVKLSPEEFFSTDLFPYFELLKSNKIHSIMVGHAAYPHLDFQETDSNNNLLPSSLNQKLITGFLRDELGFNNLVLTDDLEMGAIVKNYGVGETAKMAVKAGNDCLLICAGTDAMRESFQAVLDAVKTGEISENRIEESIRRIAQIKQILSPPLAFDAGRLEELSEEIKVLNEMC